MRQAAFGCRCAPVSIFAPLRLRFHPRSYRQIGRQTPDKRKKERPRHSWPREKFSSLISQYTAERELAPIDPKMARMRCIASLAASFAHEFGNQACGGARPCQLCESAWMTIGASMTSAI